MSRNQRLYDAIHQSGKRLQDIAEEIGADPKTVTRWITAGRLPQPSMRTKLSGAPYPKPCFGPMPLAPLRCLELVGVYTTRRELPPSAVGSLLDAAERHVDVLAYSALWLWDTVPGFVDRVKLKIWLAAPAFASASEIQTAKPSASAVKRKEVDAALAGRCPPGRHIRTRNPSQRLQLGAHQWSNPLRVHLPFRRQRAAQQPPMGKPSGRLARLPLPQTARHWHRSRRDHVV